MRASDGTQWYPVKLTYKTWSRCSLDTTRTPLRTIDLVSKVWQSASDSELEPAGDLKFENTKRPGDSESLTETSKSRAQTLSFPRPSTPLPFPPITGSHRALCPRNVKKSNWKFTPLRTTSTVLPYPQINGLPTPWGPPGQKNPAGQGMTLAFGEPGGQMKPP